MVGFLLLALICSQIPSSSQKTNSTILKEYDRKICNNEATCSWLSKYQLPENRSTLKRRNCMCDEECKLYKDCCLDSPYYDDVEQRASSEFYCPQTKRVYMKVDCASSWPSDHVSTLCRKSTKVLDSDNTWVLVPVTNPETGVTYGNCYCAICNYDRNYEVWILQPMCAEKAVPSSTKPQNQFKTNGKPNHQEPSRSEVLQGTKQFPNKHVSHTDVQFQSINAIPSRDYKVNKSDLYFSGSGARDHFNHPFDSNQPTNPPTIFSKSRTKGGFNSLQKKSESSTQEQNNNDPFFRPYEMDPKTILNIFVYGNRNPFVNEGQGTEINAYFFGDSARRKRQTELGLNFDEYAEESPEIWKTVVFDPTTKQLRSMYQGKNFVCGFKTKVPSFLEAHTRPCIPNVIVRCTDENDLDMIKACRSHTMIVWNKNTKQPYRNVACALCNGELESDTTPCPPGDREGLANAVEGASLGISDGQEPCESGQNAKKKLTC